MTKQRNTEPNVADNAPEGMELTAAEQAEARKEGAKEDVQEAAKEAHRYLTDGNLPGAAPERQYHGSDEIQQYAEIVTFGLDEFKERIAKNSDNPVPEEKVAGLLALERAGQNRTEYVKALCARLGVKDPREVTSAGPDYTNDITAITKL